MQPEGQTTSSFPLTDAGNAERFAVDFSSAAKYVVDAGHWIRWDGRRWTPDNGGGILQLAKQSARNLAQQGTAGRDAEGVRGILAHAASSESRAKLEAVVALARTEPGIRVTTSQLDADAHLLTVGNGTLDLRTGELREHRRNDYITKLADIEYDRTAYSDLWDGFVDDVTAGDADLRSYLQEIAGYALTGSTVEEALFLLAGPPASGKSTFLDAMKSVLGDYAKTADFESFLRRGAKRSIRDDIARLAGARLVTASEANPGEKLDSALVKQLVGGDAVAARQLWARTFEYKPAFKLFMATNDVPQVDHDDEGMWRRIRRVPFAHSIPAAKRSSSLKADLCSPTTSGPGILAWAVAGASRWFARGRLSAPRAVVKSTDAYRSEMDYVGQFVAEACWEEDERVARRYMKHTKPGAVKTISILRLDQRSTVLWKHAASDQSRVTVGSRSSV